MPSQFVTPRRKMIHRAARASCWLIFDWPRSRSAKMIGVSDHPGPDPLQPPEDFFLERIAAALDRGEVELLEQC